MQVRTDNYKATHGRCPNGYGMWYFTVRIWGLSGPEAETVGPFSGLYGSARTAFLQHIRAMGWAPISAEVAP